MWSVPFAVGALPAFYTSNTLHTHNVSDILAMCIPSILNNALKVFISVQDSFYDKIVCNKKEK